MALAPLSDEDNENDDRGRRSDGVRRDDEDPAPCRGVATLSSAPESPSMVVEEPGLVAGLPASMLSVCSTTAGGTGLAVASAAVVCVAVPAEERMGTRVEVDVGVDSDVEVGAGADEDADADADAVSAKPGDARCCCLGLWTRE